MSFSRPGSSCLNLFFNILSYPQHNQPSTMPSPIDPEIPPLTSTSTTKRQYLCLTILGYKKQGMTEEAYRNHMLNVSAPMTKDLMVKYGIRRWTMIHNQTPTRALMKQIFDPQMLHLADYDCFSQVVFESIEDYQRMKGDAWYRRYLVGDHENFADVGRSEMTIGWIEEFIRDGQLVEGFEGEYI
ncbi:hypothetical protein AC578_2660 [Pseudocercospora eumusae]|uniref:EthD domain-containing protein n=1 Tax=Pseudocercospora eumusae TaxID=321146 RepID=A0A139H133_9PEZI|nr:hypothetical protein AC578_2660 [Pseudocercospora eumusae]